MSLAQERVGKRINRTPQHVFQSRTTRWCNTVPVVNTYIIPFLKAASEYVDIRVKAYNQVGESDWSDPLESAETKCELGVSLLPVCLLPLCLA